MVNRFMDELRAHSESVPDYPIAYDAGKARASAAAGVGSGEFTIMWAGQAAPLSRPLAAADLVARLVDEMAREIRRLSALA